MTTQDLRRFFIEKMNRLFDLEELAKGGGSYWQITTTDSKKFYRTNFVLLEKIELDRVWEEIPLPLRLDLELFYNYALKNINFYELTKKAKRPLSIFFVCVDYGCYLFYTNYNLRFGRRDDIG